MDRAARLLGGSALLAALPSPAWAGDEALAGVLGMGGLMAAGALAWLFGNRPSDPVIDLAKHAIGEVAELVKVLRTTRRPGSIQNVILAVGIGGSGKTTFIRHALDTDFADPSKRTEHFSLYHRKHLVTVRDNGADGKTRSEVNLYIVDYKGQNIATLFSGIMAENAGRGKSPLKYGLINTLVFIVDVVPPPDNGMEIKRVPYHDPKRVDHQIKEWSGIALDAIFGLLTRESLKHVCLFINKADLLQAPDAVGKAIHAYQPLIDQLEIRCRANGIVLDTIVGSLQTGLNVNRLKQSLIDHSVAL
jgi:hypothetical protein